MNRDVVLAEIAELDRKISDLKEQLVLADGCRQGLRWVAAEMERAAVPEVEGEVVGGE